MKCRRILRCCLVAALLAVLLAAGDVLLVEAKKEKPPEKMDYYDLLGVGKKFTDQELKKAYRKEAMKWHPDKNPDNKEEAQKRFAEIGAAYDCLGNPDKRRAYDMGGRERVQDHEQEQAAGEGGMGGMDPFDLFAQMFGGEGGGGDFGGFEFRGPNGEKIDPSIFGEMGGMGGMGGMM